MAKACAEKPRKKVDPVLRKYTLTSALALAAIGLCAGAWFGIGLVSDSAAEQAPLFEKVFLSTFVSFSSAAAGLIFGGFLGSTIYRLRGKKPDDER